MYRPLDFTPKFYAVRFYLDTTCILETPVVDRGMQHCVQPGCLAVTFYCIKQHCMCLHVSVCWPVCVCLWLCGCHCSGNVAQHRLRHNSDACNKHTSACHDNELSVDQDVCVCVRCFSPVQPARMQHHADLLDLMNCRLLQLLWFTSLCCG